MKKLYILLFALLMHSMTYSQTIVTIDRANGPGPTATGNEPSISSIGITRGAGVNERPGTDFSSNNWTGASQAAAETNNDYIEWSTTANATNDIEIQAVDLVLRRNASGPGNWQLYYSLDNFATAGVAVNTPQTLVENTNTISNITGLSINSGTAGTITFRLYAWGAATNGGWLRVVRRPAWADFGIALPGIRLRGSITTTAINDVESNIVTSSFDPTDNIDYTIYNATSGLTTANAIKIGEFSIQDGGDDLTDADLVPTILTDLEFAVSNSGNIAALAIFDGASNISEVTTVSELTSFTGLTGLSAADNSSKTFEVYATFNTSVTDNDQLQLSITSAAADISAGSAFAAFDAGGAQTPIVGDDNRIEVTASQLVFDQQPTDVNLFEVMTPFPSVNATDSNNNLDLDYNNSVNVFATGPLDPPSVIYNLVSGVAVFDSVAFSEEGTGFSLFAFAPGILSAFSNPFNVNGPLVQIAVQDFDMTSPQWNYTNDIPFFDNGWGTDGYYGIIDVSSAAPLDYPYFSNNILGENDLNDEGDNGTNLWATVLFDPVNISSFTNVEVRFDWQVIGYANNPDNAQYQLFFDGVGQGRVFLFDGDNANPVEDGAGSIQLSIPDAVDEVALEIRIRNNGNNGYSGFDNFKVVSVFDGLIYADNAWTPNAPSDVTGAENAYIINGTYNVGTNIQINNLYVNNGASTEVTAGQSITANAGIINYGAVELNSVSTTYSSLIAENVEGAVIYNRHVNQLAASGSTTGNNDLVSAPVTNANQTFLAFRTANPDLPSGTIGGVPSFLFGPFDNNANAYINYTASDDASVLEAGIGYRTASTAPTGSTFRFEGDVETGTLLTPITVGTNSTFNLIGNPYPSYISLSSFLADNNSEFNATASGVYGYDGAALDGFTIWNQAYSDANPTAVIAPGQGFLVSSKAGGGTITFAPTMRSTGTTDDFIPGRLANLAHVKLQMSKTDANYNTDIYFNNNATLGMDAGYDSALFNGTTPEFALYSHLVEANTGLDLGAQAVHYDAMNNVVIPLGVNATQGEQLSIRIFESDIPDGVAVYLEDTVANTFTLLTASDYVFTPSTNLSGTGRFFLRFNEDTLSTSEANFESVQIYATQTPKTLHINGALQGAAKVELYDIQGRLILSSPLDSSLTNNQIDISTLTTGVYIVNLSNGVQQKSQKVIIR
jgi:hypothetical protein